MSHYSILGGCLGMKNYKWSVSTVAVYMYCWSILYKKLSYDSALRFTIPISSSSFSNPHRIINKVIFNISTCCTRGVIS